MRLRYTFGLATVFLLCSIATANAQQLSAELREVAGAGMLHLQNEEWSVAEEKFAFLLQKDPSALPAWFRLGYCQHQQGKLETALTSYRRAFELPSTFVSAKYNSACIYAKTGKPVQALSALTDAIENGFDKPDRLEADEDFLVLREDPKFAELVLRAKDNLAATNANVFSVAIVVYDGAELLDFAGPGEVFSVCRNREGKQAFRVWTVASSTEAITSNGFAVVMPNHSVDDCPQPDIILVPGGISLRAENDEKLMNWIREAGKDAQIVMSVCTGAFLLAKAGHLEDVEVTTHWRAIDSLIELGAGRFVVRSDVRFVDAGNVVTAAGVSAGIDAALHVVQRLHGDGIAEQTARYMEYSSDPK